MQHFNINVSGKVQGVFFRKSTLDKATSLNIKGYVRNEPDGSVFIAAEGKEEDLKNLVDWCHDGPPAADVTNVNYNTGELQNFASFTIK